jgi:BolA protein
VSARVERIRAILARGFTPSGLTGEDQSHLDVGHAGARDGRGHFRVRIVAAAFGGKAPLARHRAVYAALADMLETDIHALAVEARTPDETH